MEVVTEEKIPPCQILFIFGNGFDLSLNMKTSYYDVYETYVQNPSNSATIEAFKRDLANRKPFDKWADFETGMAQYARALSSEDEFIECIRDFKEHLANHLQEENDKIYHTMSKEENFFRVLYEWENAMECFWHHGLTHNVKKQIRDLIKDKEVIYQFLTFNYTDSIEWIRIVQEEKFDNKHSKSLSNSPLHIHGQVLLDIVLGVDNPMQLSELPYVLSRKGKRAFIKPFFNEQYDEERVQLAQQMIAESTIICTYGFSMGETDKMWTDRLIQWLESDKRHHLIIFQYDTASYNECNFDEMMDVEDEKKALLAMRLGIRNERLKNQIHIPIGHDIFNFDFS